MYNVIGDIAGNFLTLQALLAKMPEAIPLSVGDMIDRGPRSPEVVEFFRQPGRVALLGNHEHMAIYSSQYQRGIWEYNGGLATLKSYGREVVGGLPPDVVEWMMTLPVHFRYDRFLISHTFKTHGQKELPPDTNCLTPGFNAEPYVWSRRHPAPIPGTVQICGHNSEFGFQKFMLAGVADAAICLDSSWSSVLTGIHLPTMEVFEQPYID